MKNNIPNEDFESRLRHDAQRARRQAEPAADLSARILREVRHSTIVVPEPARRAWRLPLISFAGLAACAAAAIMMMMQSSPSSSQPDEESRQVPTPNVVAAPASGDASNPLWSDLRPKTAALLAQDPLQSEVNAVVADARSALQFLALNFLPAPSETQQPRSG